MRIRARKFVGTIALLVLVTVWSLLGMTVAQTPWLAASGLYQAIFFVVAGIGWGVPAQPSINWVLGVRGYGPSMVRKSLTRIASSMQSDLSPPGRGEEAARRFAKSVEFNSPLSQPSSRSAARAARRATAAGRPMQCAARHADRRDRKSGV